MRLVTRAAFGATLATGFLLSCNLFETRTPENPVQASANFRPPTEIDVVFANMQNAFSDLNSLNYTQSFSDSTVSGRSFSFVPTPQAASQFPGLFTGWTRQSEQQYFDNFKIQLQTNAVPSLLFTVTSESIGSDSAYVEGTYQLTIPHTKPQVGQSASGRYQFFFFKDMRQYWVIRRWVDLSNQAGDLTWSDLKGAFGQ